MRGTWTAGMILGAALLAGCSTTGPFGRDKLVVPVGPSYVGGRGVQAFPTSPNLLDNVKDAMTDVGMHSIRQVPEPNGLMALQAVTADGRAARVTIQTTGVRSLVASKIGWFGDEPLTRALLDRLGTRQGSLGPALDPAEAPAEAERPDNPFLSRRAVSDSTMLRDRLDSGLIPSLTPSINP